MNRLGKTFGSCDEALRCNARLWLGLLVLVALGPVMGLCQEVTELGPAAQKSGVPAWNVRGLGPLPWQGVACIDMTADAGRIVLGTIAPPGDPNVLVLDGVGKLIAQYRAGQRFVGEVALSGDGRSGFALVTTPRGTAGDRPEVYRFDVPGKSGAVLEGMPHDALMFHYGDHSNHLGAFMQTADGQTALACGEQVFWLWPKRAGNVTRSHVGGSGRQVTAAALGPGGRMVVGCTGRPPAEGKPAENLFLVAADAPKPCPTRPRRSGSTVTAPCPSGTCETMSSAARRSAARPMSEAKNPLLASGATVTKPQEAKW